MPAKKQSVHQNEQLLERLLAEKDGKAARNFSFIERMMDQNLTHARHVENERLAYCAAVTTLTTLTVTFIGNIQSDILKWAIPLLLVAIILNSILLNNRWNTAFDRHMEYAKRCYYILDREIFHDLAVPVKNPKDHEDFFFADEKRKTLGLGHLPLYSFNIKTPDNFKTRTNTYFKLYYCFLLAIALFTFVHFFIAYIKL